LARLSVAEPCSFRAARIPRHEDARSTRASPCRDAKARSCARAELGAGHASLGIEKKCGS
jgi:hypothetical protein